MTARIQCRPRNRRRPNYSATGTVQLVAHKTMRNRHIDPATRRCRIQLYSFDTHASLLFFDDGQSDDHRGSNCLHRIEFRAEDGDALFAALFGYRDDAESIIDMTPLPTADVDPIPTTDLDILPIDNALEVAA